MRITHRFMVIRLIIGHFVGNSQAVVRRGIVGEAYSMSRKSVQRFCDHDMLKHRRLKRGGQANLKDRDTL
ncbi:hypothetical protein SAMN05880593_10469 [Rhizobium sp. RU36D]|nr:hypothetical protein SAMN05880593_10469 [Rhizobium sp. RU36D]